MGMMAGGGAGREAAAWIVHGAPDLDMFSYDCSRFHPETAANEVWVRDRTHESYAKTYSIVFPHDENLAGRGARRSALHNELEDRGCVFQARQGFERPGWFVKDPVDLRPKEYDYGGAYAEGAWRLTSEHPDVPGHKDHDYNDILQGELTFDWPASMKTVADECEAARNGVV
jgi:sarcosine dehydrogenase